MEPEAAAVAPSIYVLGWPSQRATIALKKALDTVGYIHSGELSSNDRATTDADTYAEISSSTEYMEIASVHPEAKFILPRRTKDNQSWASLWIGGFFQARIPQQFPDPSGREEDTTAGSTFEHNCTHSVCDFFAKTGRSQRLLELDVSALEPGMQAEKWVVLCDFLELGYSVVERLKLRRFPQ